MAEYIKKEDVLKEVVRFSTEEGSNTVCSKLYCDMGLMPTTDIVHCKECKNWGKSTPDGVLAEAGGICYETSWLCGEQGYCMYGIKVE